MGSFEETLPFHAAAGYNHLVLGSFHPLSGVLFNFPSRYYYAIGLNSYLELEVDASHIHARYPTHATLDIPQSFRTCLRGFNPLRRPVPGNFGLSESDCIWHINPTSPSYYYKGFGLLNCRFRSPLLTASQLISFPADTKMLQFSAFLLVTEYTLPKQSTRISFGDSGFKGYVRLARKYRSLSRPSSAS
jgi:hypothetical protein